MDEESLSNLIGMIYEASLEPGLWPDVMQHLAAATPSVAAMISSYDKLAGTTIFHQSFGLDADYMAIYAEKWGADNPLVGSLLLLEPGEVSGLPALIDFEAFKRHPFYLEWGKPQGFYDAINMMLERTPTRFCVRFAHPKPKPGACRHSDHPTLKNSRASLPACDQDWAGPGACIRPG